MESIMIGQIERFGGNFAPRGWAFCNGQLLSISTNQALFSILGTTYGGDGRTTFALPDFRGRVAISSGTGPGLTTRPLGARSGSETVTLLITQMPQHTHNVYPQYSNTPGQINPANNFPGNVGQPVYGSSGDGNMGEAAVGSAGGNQSHDNMQPWLCCEYIIALVGPYPSRN